MKKTPRVVHRIVIALTESLKVMQAENASLTWGQRKFNAVVRSLDVTRHLASDARKVASLDLPADDSEGLVAEITATSELIIETRKKFMADCVSRTALVAAVFEGKQKHIEVRRRTKVNKGK